MKPVRTEAELKQISSAILWQINAEIMLLNDSPAKNYKKWFLNESKVFHDVDITKSKELAKRYRTQVKRCYHNSFMARLAEPGLKYFEGYVWSADIPIPLEHSWLVKDNLVIDTTMVLDKDFSKEENRRFKRKYGRDLGTRKLGDEYVGLEIPKDYILKQCLKTEKSGPFIFDYWNSKFGEKLKEKK